MNFAALSTRFISTDRSWPASPRTSGSSPTPTCSRGIRPVRSSSADCISAARSTTSSPGRLALLRELQQVVDQVGHPVDATARAGQGVELVGLLDVELERLERQRDGRQRVLQVVADLAGELGEALVGGAEAGVGRAEASRGELELEDVHHPVGELGQASCRLGRHLVGPVVEDAQRADGDAGGRRERVGAVVLHVGELAGRPRVVGEAHVVAGVLEHDRLAALHHEPAHRVVDRRVRAVEPGRRDLVLRVGAQQVDSGEGYAGDLGGELHEGVELTARRPVEDVVRRDRAVACLCLPHNPGAFQTASHRCRSGSMGSSAPSRSRTDSSSSVSRVCSPEGAKG